MKQHQRNIQTLWMNPRNNKNIEKITIKPLTTNIAFDILILAFDA